MAEQYLTAYTRQIDLMKANGKTQEEISAFLKAKQDDLSIIDLFYLKSYVAKIFSR